MDRVPANRRRPAPTRGAVKNEFKPPLLCVRDWDTLYENNRSRELTRTTWVPVPNDLSADWYVELASHEEGAAHFGVWNAILMVASRCSPRGLLRREDGRPHTSESLARMARLPQAVVEATLARAIEFGLLETLGSKPRKKNELPSHPGAAKPQQAAPTSHQGAAEGKGIEHHHQKGKRRENEVKRTEPPGTEAPGVESSPAGSVAAIGSGSSSPKNADDDSDDQSPAEYASPEDDLKAIYLAKAREHMTIDLLDAIRMNLECAGVGMSDFVALVKKHSRGNWNNPPGLVRYLSQTFSAKIRPTGAPVTAAEAAAKNYRCEICFSRIPGEGVRQGPDGTFIPCTCAGPEYIAHLQERGVFGRETAQ